LRLLLDHLNSNFTQGIGLILVLKIKFIPKGRPINQGSLLCKDRRLHHLVSKTAGIKQADSVQIVIVLCIHEGSSCRLVKQEAILLLGIYAQFGQNVCMKHTFFMCTFWPYLPNNKITACYTNLQLEPSCTQILYCMIGQAKKCCLQCTNQWISQINNLV